MAKKHVSPKLKIPDKPGVWQSETGQLLEVYELTPVGGILCFWADDLSPFSGISEFWNTDEWSGHFPVTALEIEFEYGDWILTSVILDSSLE
jgi:hypothetical protein